MNEKIMVSIIIHHKGYDNDRKYYVAINKLLNEGWIMKDADTKIINKEAISTFTFERNI